jgi:hypothetical protein
VGCRATQRGHRVVSTRPQRPRGVIPMSDEWGYASRLVDLAERVIVPVAETV